MVIIKLLDWEQREQVGYSFIIDKLEVMTSFGMEEKKNISPFKDGNLLMEELDNVEAIIASIRKSKEIIDQLERVFCRVKDIKNTLERCKNNITLDDVELFEIKNFTFLMEELLLAYEGLGLNIKSISFNALKEVYEVLDPEHKKIAAFHIYEGYSERLKVIREEKRTVESQIYKERDSEKISFLKEKRLNIVIEEEEEELNIRKYLTEKLCKYVSFMEENIRSIGRLDFLLAKAKLSIKYSAVKPAISEEFKIVLEDMYHPEVVEILESKNKCFTPVSISLKAGTTVITGANMGGKSVALKTAVLNLLLAQCGFFVFAKAAEIPVLNFIFFISDDMQSVCQGLSTFGAEIIKLKEVIENAKWQQGFIVLDEFARGTNPKEGSYLVRSLCKYLNSLSSISLIATHYDNMVESGMVHYQVAGLKNVNFEALKCKIKLNQIKSIDILQESMEYRLIRVSEAEGVPKDALNIAILLGLQKEIIDNAKVYYEEGLGEKDEK